MPEQSSERPVIGITIGDFNGIGPEVILKTLSDPRILKQCIPVVYGSYKILGKYKKLIETQEEVNFHQIKNINEIQHRKINIINCWEEDLEPEPGKVTTQAGIAAFQALEKASTDLQSGGVQALVTAPVNKKNIQQDNFNFPGHTEYLADRFKSDSLMMMVSEFMKVAVVTGHIPLSEVKSAITADKISKQLNIFYKSLKNDFQIIKPKVAILGLNPHAGEEGMLGKEDLEIIQPLIEDLKNKGILVSGPFPSDAFFGMHLYNKFDGVLAMYHDQGLIPFKTLSFETGVNFTAGLPVIRTSPDHGTAYDIAGKNKANENSFRHALYLACDLVKQKRSA